MAWTGLKGRITRFAVLPGGSPSSPIMQAYAAGKSGKFIAFHT